MQRSSQTAWYVAWVIGPVHKSVIMHRLSFIIIIIVKASELGGYIGGQRPFSFTCHSVNCSFLQILTISDGPSFEQVPRPIRM